jgi:hypothetical protein
MVRYTVSLSQVHRAGLLKIVDSQEEAENFAREYVDSKYELENSQSFHVYKRLYNKSINNPDKHLVIEYYVESVVNYGWLWTIKCSKEDHLFSFIIDTLNESKTPTFLTELKERLERDNFGLLFTGDQYNYTDIELFSQEELSPLLADIRYELERRRRGGQ